MEPYLNGLGPCNGDLGYISSFMTVKNKDSLNKVKLKRHWFVHHGGSYNMGDTFTGLQMPSDNILSSWFGGN